MLFIRYWVYIGLLLIFLPLNSAQAVEYFKVKSVINGKSFIIESGDKVRIASIETPNVQEEDTPSRKGRPGEPLGEEAKQALAKLILGKKIRIMYNPGIRDRHNRLLGQVYLEDGRWVQGEILKSGYAMVYSFNDDSHAIIEKMLAAEKPAIAGKLGIWADPYYRIIKAEEAGQFLNRFKLVEGKVVSVNEYHGNIYINYNEHWKGNFSVFISRKNIEAFSGMDLKSLAGKTIRVRGWINDHKGPSIDITHPEQIELF